MTMILLMTCLLTMPAKPPQPQTYALLIGVGSYHADDINDLKGPANDVALMADLLGRLYPGADIRRLVDNAATQAAILKALAGYQHVQNHDRVIIYYSGHGSKAPDQNGDEGDDGEDETWVVYGSRACDHGLPDCPTPTGDLRDDTLQAFLGAIPTRNLIVISDSCHSGTIGRDTFRTRLAPPAHQAVAPLPVDLPSFDPRKPFRGARLAAAEDQSKAYEREFAGQAHGLFTHHLAAAIRAAGPTTSWKTIFKRAERAVQLEPHVVQLPIFEGDGNLTLGAAPMSDAVVTVERPLGPERWLLDKGAASGLTRGSLIRGESITLTVESVTSYTAEARWLSGNPPKPGMVLLIADYGLNRPRRVQWRIEPGLEPAQNLLNGWLGQHFSGRIETFSNQQVTPDWWFQLKGHPTYGVQIWQVDEGGRPLLSRPLFQGEIRDLNGRMQPFDHSLRTLLRRDTLLNLTTPGEPDFKFEAFLYLKGSGKPGVEHLSFGKERFHFAGDLKSGTGIPQGAVVGYRVTNQSSSGRFILVLNFGADGSVRPCFPMEHRQNAPLLHAGTSLTAGKAEMVYMSEPGEEYLMVISSSRQLDLDDFRVPKIETQVKDAFIGRDATTATLNQRTDWSAALFRFHIESNNQGNAATH